MLLLALAGTTATAFAQAREVTLIAPGGIRAAIEQLVPEFERKTGITVKPTFGSGLGTKQQVALGEAFDVPILQPPYQEVLASGNLVAASAKTLARVEVGVAVRKGAPRPDISSPDSVRRALLTAKSIAYPDPAGGAAAGVSFDQMLRRLGIAAQVESKLIRARGGGAAMEIAAKGEAEIGVTFVSEMQEPGLDIVGPLPASILPPTTLVGFVSTHAKDPAFAKALLKFLASREAEHAYRAQHMHAGK